MKITVYEVNTGNFIADPIKYGAEYNVGELPKFFTRKKEASKCFLREVKRLRHDDVEWFGVVLNEKTYNGSPRAIAASALCGKGIDDCTVLTTTLDRNVLTEKEIQKRWVARNYK